MGIKVIRFNRTILEMADAIETRRVKLIETVRTVNDKGSLGTKFAEDVRKRLRESGVVDTCELDICTRRVGQRTEDIEDGALTNLLARTNGILHSRMKLGRKHKSDANLLYGLRNLFGREFEIDAESRENIRG